MTISKNQDGVQDGGHFGVTVLVLVISSKPNVRYGSKFALLLTTRPILSNIDRLDSMKKIFRLNTKNLTF